MLAIPNSIQTVNILGSSVELVVPDAAWIKQRYEQQLKEAPGTPPPFWAQIWPSAIALTEYLAENPTLVAGKNVIELGAGLGLPSLFAAQTALSVFCTDYLPEPLAFVDASIERDGLDNMKTGLLDWHQQIPPTEIVLASDINYQPNSFESILDCLSKALENGVTIILSTPQRLLAKPFIAALAPWTKSTQERIIIHQSVPVPISIMLLSANKGKLV